MKINRFFVIIAVIAGGLLPLCLAWRAAPPAAAAPATLDADLQAALADAPPDAAIRILIHAHGRSNLASASL
ncbi:MAG: hypothetical protein KC425_27180, partial [Anaerolineales bacterium]|nr:hypothetical protein [Anaerolineales bacterium]